jgi:hypothetical protein
MKLIKVVILLILQVLICFNGLLQAQTISLPLQGSNLEDSIKVELPISLIKKANERLIERKYLISIYYEQDSIIQFQNSYIANQSNIINTMQERIVINNQINEDLNKALDKQKKKNKIITYGAVGVVAGLLIGVLIK